jgi:hypothetical protein
MMPVAAEQFYSSITGLIDATDDTPVIISFFLATPLDAAADAFDISLSITPLR